MASDQCPALARLTAGALHELNNMLGALSGSAAIVRNYAGGDTRLLGAAEVTESSLERASEIVGSVLGLLTKTGRRREPVAVAALFDAAEAHVKTLNATLACSAAPGIGAPLGDQLELCGALKNACAALIAALRGSMGPAQINLGLSAVNAGEGEHARVQFVCALEAQLAGARAAAAECDCSKFADDPQIFSAGFARALIELNGGQCCFRVNGSSKSYFALSIPTV